MKHPSRTARKANEARIREAWLKQWPLDSLEQQRRAEANAATRDAYRAANPGGVVGSYARRVRVAGAVASNPVPFAWGLMRLMIQGEARNRRPHNAKQTARAK